jgi:hypothetical protein
MAFCFTSQMIIAGIGGGSALPLFKDIRRPLMLYPSMFAIV